MPASVGWCRAVKYQTNASPTMTATTTNAITVSCHMAKGKNGFPSFLTSSL